MDDIEKQIYCCLNCNPELDVCLAPSTSSSPFTESCPDDYKDITSNCCKVLLEPYCSIVTDENINIKYPDNVNEQCWKALICNSFGSCEIGYNQYQTYSQFETCNNFLTEYYNLTGFTWSENVISELLQNYKSIGYQIGSSINSSKYSPFQDRFYNNICCLFPALCQSSLSRQCSDVTKYQSSQPELRKWCGCHLRSDIYSEYSKIYSLSPSCTPFCNLPDNIPITDSSGQPIICQQDSCIISDDTLRIVNSTINNTNVNTVQICGSCQGNCQCVVDGNSINLINGTISNSNINFVDICKNFTVQVNNPSSVGPDYIPIPFNDISDLTGDKINEYKQIYIDQYNKEKRRNEIYNIFLIILLIFFLIILFGFIIYFFIL